MDVTLHARVWIEIGMLLINIFLGVVTLHVRVWIEIKSSVNPAEITVVTLYARVWIEFEAGTKIFDDTLRVVIRRGKRK